jgi:hypothetical protein
MEDRPNSKPGPSGPPRDGPRGSPPGHGGFPQPPVRVLRIDLRPDDGRPLKAFADVEIAAGLIIRGFRIIEDPGRRPRVVCPQVSIKQPGREPFFRTVITLPDALKGAVDFAILCAWQAATAGREEKSQCPVSDI